MSGRQKKPRRRHKPKKPRRYHKLTDGEWIVPRLRGFREQCCDCALVHIIDYRINAAGEIEFRARRDARATAAARKVFRFTKETD